MPDWPKRMKALNFDEKQVKLINTCREKLAEWYKIKDNAPWKLQEDSAKEKVRVDCYTSPRDKNSFKASGVVDFPPWVVL